MTKESLRHIVAGNIKSVIQQHGPITQDLVSSATKRITNSLYGTILSELIQGRESEATEKLSTNIRRMVKTMRGLRKNRYDMMKLLDAYLPNWREMIKDDQDPT